MPANPELLEITTQLLKNCDNGSQALVSLLETVQNQFGYVPPSVVGLIADQAEVSRPEVYNAIELSPSFSLTPSGDHKLFICNADNCCMQGGTELMEHAIHVLGVKPFETTADKKIRLESFQCLGNCSMAPNVMVNGRVHGMMDTKELDKLIEELKQ